MGSINTATPGEIAAALAAVGQDVSTRAVLEHAAQRCCDVLYRAFEESIVLTRFFATVPYQALPQRSQTFVDVLARSKEIRPLLLPQTPVLSLLGTRGAKTAWSDRRLSEGHVGIPLVSLSFIDSIPMISRLLRELDSNLHWLGSDDRFVQKVLGGGSAGLFFVDDARSAVDAQGRRVIAARDFVRDNDVKTVFGIGRNFGQGAMFVQIFFLRETVARARAMKLMPLANSFRGAAMLDGGQIFAPIPVGGVRS